MGHQHQRSRAYTPPRSGVNTCKISALTGRSAPQRLCSMTFLRAFKSPFAVGNSCKKRALQAPLRLVSAMLRCALELRLLKKTDSAVHSRRKCEGHSPSPDIRPTTATALALSRCCFLRGCGLCGVVLGSVAVFCSEHPERNANMTPSRQQIKRKVIKRNRKLCFEGQWGSLGGPWSHFGTGGSKVSAGTRNCFKYHMFCWCEFRKLAFCSGMASN